MIVSDIIAALDLPPGAGVDRRVPKMLLAEHGAPTAADKLLQQSYAGKVKLTHTAPTSRYKTSRRSPPADRPR